MDSELIKFANCDPKILEILDSDTAIAKSSANRWTDNCFLVSQWIREKKPGVTQEELEKNFGVLKDLDNIA